MVARRGPDGRWLKTGGDVPADGSGPPTAIVILPQVDDPAGLAWGTRTVSAGFAVDLNAGHLVDSMTRAFMDHIRTSLMEGQRPDGGGEQKALSRQALSDPDRESPHRGFKTGELADGIYRTPIKSTGPTASSTVQPPASRNAYVGKERQRGVLLLTGAGVAGQVSAAAAQETARVMAEGRTIITSAGEVRAKDAEP
jgi:hypothetical protein